MCHKAHRFSILGLAFSAFFIIFSYALGQDPEPAGANNTKLLSQAALARMTLPGTHDLQLVIELVQPSVVESLTASNTGTAVPLVAPSGTRVRLDPALSV